MVFGMIGTEKEEVMRPVVLLVGRAQYVEKSVTEPMIDG